MWRHAACMPHSGGALLPCAIDPLPSAVRAWASLHSSNAISHPPVHQLLPRLCVQCSYPPTHPSPRPCLCPQALAALPSLQRVTLRRCGSITTAGVYCMLLAPALQRLVIAGCPLVEVDKLLGFSSLQISAGREGSQPLQQQQPLLLQQQQQGQQEQQHQQQGGLAAAAPPAAPGAGVGVGVAAALPLAALPLPPAAQPQQQGGQHVEAAEGAGMALVPEAAPAWLQNQQQHPPDHHLAPQAMLLGPPLGHQNFPSAGSMWVVGAGQPPAQHHLGDL